MGQFSWITQDTKEAVRESIGCEEQSLTTAYMTDNKGNEWEELKYEGYGKFDGQDFFELVATMNGLGPDRSAGIDLVYSGESYLSPNINRHKGVAWKNEIPESDPNQGWGDGIDEDEEDEYYWEDDEWDEDY